MKCTASQHFLFQNSEYCIFLFLIGAMATIQRKRVLNKQEPMPFITDSHLLFFSSAIELYFFARYFLISKATAMMITAPWTIN